MSDYFEIDLSNFDLREELQATKINFFDDNFGRCMKSALAKLEPKNPNWAIASTVE